MVVSAWVWIGSFLATGVLLGIGRALLRSPWSGGGRFTAGWLLATAALLTVAAAVLGRAGGAGQGVNLLNEYAQEAPFAIDTVLAFALILRRYLPDGDHRTAALYGVVTTLVLRVVFITAVTGLVSSHGWLLYLVGLVVVYAAVALARAGHPHPAEHDGTPERRLTRAVARWGRRTGPNGLAYLPPLALAVVLLTLEDPLVWPDGGPAYPTVLANVLALLPVPVLVRYSEKLMALISYLPSGLGVVGGFLGVKIILFALADNVLPFLNGGEPIEWVPQIGAVLSLAVTAGTIGITLAASLSRRRRLRRAAHHVTTPATEPPPSCSPAPGQNPSDRQPAPIAVLRSNGRAAPRSQARARITATTATVVVATGLAIVAGILVYRRRRAGAVTAAWPCPPATAPPGPTWKRSSSTPSARSVDLSDT